MDKKLFGTCPDGEVWEYRLVDAATGMSANIITFGARVVDLYVPDGKGGTVDVVCGYDNLDGYVSDSDPHFGAAIGRYGNRIAHAQFTLSGKKVVLNTDNPATQLHGGVKGFGKRLWNAEPLSDNEIKMTYTSADGEEGFPGRLDVTIIYRLTGGALRIEYTAAAHGADTVCNLTNHSYFNLNGHNVGDILRHTLTIAADQITDCDSDLNIDGTLIDVAGTAFDFNTAKAIGRDIDDYSLKAMEYGKGYDVNYCLRGEGFREIARARGDLSGITMSVLTTEPGVQLYTGNGMDGICGKGGAIYNRCAAFCLETQKYPNSPNIPEFPSTTLKDGETYTSVTEYRFSV